MRRRYLLAMLLLCALPIAAWAQDAPAPTVESVNTRVAGAEVAINFVWTLVAGFLVMLMQLGFCMVETGFTRAKNAAHTATMNFMVYGVAMMAYWALGFAIQAGGVGTLGGLGTFEHAKEAVISLGGKDWGLFGTQGFFLTGVAYTSPVFAYFLF
jgi:ammonium transporter, Amt family